MKRFLLFLSLLAFAFTGSSQVQYVSFRIDSAVKAAMQERQIPGLQVIVVKYGLVIKKGHYGYANLEDRLPVTDSTMFSIGSMSKAMTDAGILLLMENDKLNLQDSIGKYFDSLPASWSGITIRMLMNHTSGLRNDWTEETPFFYAHNTDSALFSALRMEPLKFQPGTEFNCSCGPFLLGLIIARVSGETYADFMQHHIFDKLGMKNTRVNEADAVIPNRAAGYRIKNDRLAPGIQIPGEAMSRGDIGILSSATDLLKWYTALQDSSLLKKTSLDLMFAPATLSDGSLAPYGLGWILRPYRDHPLISHGGFTRTGYNSYIEMYPEDGVCIIVLSNLAVNNTGPIAKDIIGLFNKDYARASQMDAVADPDSVRSLLLKSDFTEIGLNLDTARSRARTLHMGFYPETEKDLWDFRNVEEFTFIKSIKPKKPAANVFGDVIQSIYLYKIKCRDRPARYAAFMMDPAGSLVYLNYEE